MISHGVVPSLHGDYKHTRIKQYHKEDRALRTETTINDTRDFALGKRLHNLSALRAVGFSANPRLLDVQRTSHACTMGEDQFQQLNRPLRVGTQRASALAFADPLVQGLLAVLVLFCFLPRGFSTRELRDRLAPLLGRDPSAMTPGQMTYHLRRLRHRRLIERTPHTHRYRVTPTGLRTALFCTRIYPRLLRPGFACLSPDPPAAPPKLRTRFDQLEAAIDAYIASAKLAA